MALLPPPANGNSPDELRAGNFTFINESRNLGPLPPDWSPRGASKLWLYNLHYFEWLWLLDDSESLAAVSDWIENYPLETGKDGWEPYPTSLRLMNWAAWIQCRANPLDNQTRQRIWESIWLQCEWLLRRLEFHLLGNHLLENGMALAFVGSVFNGSDAERWACKGWEILDRELPEQVLPDGMHFELSPMYHARVLSVLDWLVAVAPSNRKATLIPCLERMAGALARMTHPDGGVALLNDSAFGIYHRSDVLLSRFADMGTHDIGPFALEGAGYFGARTNTGDYVVIDAGLPGPDYIPGHAHGDLLSFELSIAGRRIITDSGVYDYLNSPMRAYCRSTRAHNTVEINGQEQSEFWGAFRVARRAKPRDVSWRVSGESFRFAASHDGYRRLASKAIHRRDVEWSGRNTMTLRDNIEAKSAVDAIGRLHFHPEVKVLQGDSKNEFLARRDKTLLTIIIFAADEVWIEDSWYCPEFGIKISRPYLCWKTSGATQAVETRLEWTSSM